MLTLLIRHEGGDAAPEIVLVAAIVGLVGFMVLRPYLSGLGWGF